MPSLRTWLPVAAVPVVMACGLLSFDVEQQSETVIPGQGLLGDLLEAIDFTGLDDFDVAIEQELADQGVQDGDLKSVTLTRLELTSEPDLHFIEKIDVYVSAEGIDRVLVATSASFPDGQPTVALGLTGVDLTPMVVAGGMRFSAEVEGNPPAEDQDLVVDVGVFVEATAQGACNAAKGEPEDAG